MRGDFPGFERLAQAGARPGDVTELEKWSYLHRALIGPSSPPPSEMIRRLIEWGVDVNGADMYGNTPLYYAVRQNAAELVRILLEAGAAVNTRNRDGVSVLKASLAYNPVNHEVVRALLDAGADVHEKFATGQSILERVAETAHKDQVLHQIFLDHESRSRAWRICDAAVLSKNLAQALLSSVKTRSADSEVAAAAAMA